MSKVKSVENYFMNLNGFAYDPMKEGRNIYIKVVNLENHDHKVLFNIINRKTAVVNMSTMSVNELNQVLKDLYRNLSLILEGVNFILLHNVL